MVAAVEWPGVPAQKRNGSTRHDLDVGGKAVMLQYVCISICVIVATVQREGQSGEVTHQEKVDRVS